MAEGFWAFGLKAFGAEGLRGRRALGAEGFGAEGFSGFWAFGLLGLRALGG